MVFGPELEGRPDKNKPPWTEGVSLEHAIFRWRASHRKRKTKKKKNRRTAFDPGALDNVKKVPGRLQGAPGFPLFESASHECRGGHRFPEIDKELVKTNFFD